MYSKCSRTDFSWDYIDMILRYAKWITNKGNVTAEYRSSLNSFCISKSFALLATL